MATPDNDAPRQEAIDDERRERRRASAQRYRETHGDELRERTRLWKAAHPDKVKEYRDRFNAQHREQVLEDKRDYERARAAKERRAAATAERRRARQRERYAGDPDTHREYQRTRRAAQRAADPEGYREAKKQRNKRWRDGHRDEQYAKLRANHRDKPELKRAAAAKYYALHGDQVRERRRAYYRAHREQQLAKQSEWREREKRRLAVGLPPRRRHRVTAEQRSANGAAADDFFARVWSADDIAAMRRRVAGSAVHPESTPDELLAAFERQSKRQRIAHALVTDATFADRMRVAEERARAAADRRRQSATEEARQDAIARAINDRLRTQPRRRTPRRSGAAPHTTPGGPSAKGLGL